MSSPPPTPRFFNDNTHAALVAVAVLVGFAIGAWVGAAAETATVALFVAIGTLVKTTIKSGRQLYADLVDTPDGPKFAAIRQSLGSTSQYVWAMLGIYVRTAAATAAYVAAIGAVAKLVSS